MEREEEVEEREREREREKGGGKGTGRGTEREGWKREKNGRHRKVEGERKYMLARVTE